MVWPMKNDDLPMISLWFRYEKMVISPRTRYDFACESRHFRRHLWGRHGAHDPGLVFFCWSGKPIVARDHDANIRSMMLVSAQFNHI